MTWKLYPKAGTSGGIFGLDPENPNHWSNLKAEYRNAVLNNPKRKYEVILQIPSDVSASSKSYLLR